jgi:hypothetical protein
MKKATLKIHISLLTFFFLLAILTLAFHYERYTFRLAGCSICNIKNSTTLSVQKIKSDPLSPMAAGRPWTAAIFLGSPEILSAEAPAYVPLLFSCTLFNKAPPIIS